MSQLGVDTKSQKSTMLGQVILLLLQTAFLLGAAYGAYSNGPQYAWLFGILFVHSLLDRQFYLKPNLMDAYLLFTVVFYYTRWVMGWGNQGTTIFKEDAPNWVRVLKDFAWVGFLLAVGLKAALRLRLDRRTPLWFSVRGRRLMILAVVYCLLPVLTLLVARGNLFEVLLYSVRYPLEYVPMIFLLPFVLRGRSSLPHLRFFVPLIIITLLFLTVEIFSGRPTGMGWGGIYNRYGSIFGSPNDFGVFLMLSITVLLAFMVEGAIAWSLKTVTFLALCLCALASTVSLSAVFSMGFSGLGLVFLAKRKLAGLLALVAFVLMAAGLYFAFSQAGVLMFLTERAGNLSTFRDSSAYGHYVGVIDGLKEVSRFSPEEFLTGTLGSRTELVAPETYYLRIIYLRGIPALLVLLSIIVVSIAEAYRRYRGAPGSPQQRGLFLAIMVCLCSFSFASLFIPYFDTFPSNFYFWFLVGILWSEPDATLLPKTSTAPPGQGSKARSDFLELKKPSSLSSSVRL